MTEQDYKTLFEQVLRTSNKHSEDLMEWDRENDCYLYATMQSAFVGFMMGYDLAKYNLSDGDVL